MALSSMLSPSIVLMLYDTIHINTIITMNVLLLLQLYIIEYRDYLHHVLPDQQRFMKTKGYNV